VAEFESRFAEAVGARHAVAVNSCTAALQIALACWDIGPGDEVLLPTMTFASALEVVLHRGATPVLVDVRADDLTIDVDHARSLVTPRTRVIMPMHYGGQPYDVKEVQALARAHDLLVLDDAAHAFPAATAHGPVGSLADISCFSFYANKTLTTGEGGMLVTDDGDWARACRSLSLHGLSGDAWTRFARGGSWNYDIVRLGYKSNLTDVAAAMGLSQLTRADSSHRRRQAVAAYYERRLAGLPNVSTLTTHGDRVSAHHLMVVRLSPEHYDRDLASQRMSVHGVGTSVHYKPLHRHPFVLRELRPRAGAFPNAEAAFGDMLSLPLFAGMTPDDVDHVVDTLRDVRTRQP
jgi:perosamine synthetase